MHMRLRFVLLSLAVAALPVLTACAAPPGLGTGDGAGPPGGSSELPTAPADLPSELPASDLDGSWHLVSGSDASGRIVLAGGRSVTLDVLGTKASGTSACNRYMGTFTRDGDHLAFGPLGSTEMACEPAVMKLESRYLNALGSVDTVAVSPAKLTLSGPSVELAFRRTPPPASPDLVGTHWALDSLVAGDTVASTTTRARLFLAGDGTLTGGTGCRSFTGTYRVAGDRLTVPTLVPERSACTGYREPEDAHVLAVLRGETTVTLEGQTLTLSKDDGTGLVYRNARAVLTGPSGVSD